MNISCNGAILKHLLCVTLPMYDGVVRVGYNKRQLSENVTVVQGMRGLYA